jgi:glycosyltransferase involved in cell wall biosynthesis
VRIRDDRSLLLRTPALLRRALRIRFDVIIVGFRAHSDMFVATLLSKIRGVPLIFDPLTSRYEERVIDRQLDREGSWLARWYAVTDQAGCKAADLLLLETDAQISYFVQTFALARSQCRRVWLGADDEIMRPHASSSSRGLYTVFFYGGFSPLHGVEHIVRAAARLEQRHEPVTFVLVGAGQTYQMARELAERLGVSTIRFLEPVPYPKLAVMMSEADVCLGSFGTTSRAQRVIPYKVFDALAVGRPVITADTPAIREALTHGQHAWLCPCGDGEALADAIARLKRQPDLCRSLAANGHQLFKERFSLEAMTRDLAEIVGQLVRDKGAHSLSH